MVSGVVGAFVLTLISLVAVVVIVVVLWRRVQRRSLTELTQRRVESLERSDTTEVGQAAGVKGANEEAVAFGREALYQQLDERTQDYCSVYAQLTRGDTYQELNPWSREMEHHYQTVNQGKKGHGRRM